MYGLFLPYSKQEVLPDEVLTDPNIPRFPVEFMVVAIYSNATDQMGAYANTRCPASQTFEADSVEEFREIVEGLKDKFQDPKWLSENIDPYI